MGLQSLPTLVQIQPSPLKGQSTGEAGLSPKETREGSTPSWPADRFQPLVARLTARQAVVARPIGVRVPGDQLDRDVGLSLWTDRGGPSAARPGRGLERLGPSPIFHPPSCLLAVSEVDCYGVLHAVPEDKTTPVYPTAAAVGASSFSDTHSPAAAFDSLGAVAQQVVALV